MRNLFLLITLGFLASCASREKLVARSWRFSDMEIENNTDTASLAFADMAREQMRTNLIVKLDVDSSYTIMQLKQGTAVHGRWWFSPNKKVLFTKTDLGLNQYKILSLTKSKLVYEVKDATSGNLIKMSCVAIAGSK